MRRDVTAIVRRRGAGHDGGRPAPRRHRAHGPAIAHSGVAHLLLAVALARGLAWPAVASQAEAASLAFPAAADARVEEERPEANFGADPGLRTDGGGDPEVRSYLRFDVGGVAGRVSRATLRLYVAAGGETADGPQVYRAGNDWREADVAWNDQPAPSGAIVDDAGAIAEEGWLELDVTRVVDGNGVYTFALFPQSGDGANFHAREADHPPQLVVATGDDGGGGPRVSTPTPPPGSGGDGAAIRASVETTPVRHGDDAADDAAVWIHPTDPGRSAIVGTDKLGGLAIYDLAGEELAYYADSTPNNVDLRYNFPVGGERIALVVTSDTDTDSLRAYQVDPATRELDDVTVRPIDVGIGVAGLCMYVSPVSGRYFAFVGDSSGTVQQWELFDDGTGKVDAAKVRTLSVGSTTEGCVADDGTGDLYVAEEDVGIWRYGAEPEAGGERTEVDAVGGGHLTADVEGLAIYYGGDGGGYLLASSQGSDEFVVYERRGGNAYVTTFSVTAGAVDGVSHTDGLDVTNAALGVAFPNGLFVAQDDRNGDDNQNFKLVPWDDIARAASPPLAVDTGWDPRRVGG